MQQAREPLVATAARIAQQMSYQYKEQMMAGLIIGGWDEKLGGQVYNIPLGGMLQRQPFSIGGSGSMYIYGYCDAHFKKGMTQDECIAFVKKCTSSSFLVLAVSEQA